MCNTIMLKFIQYSISSKYVIEFLTKTRLTEILESSLWNFRFFYENLTATEQRGREEINLFLSETCWSCSSFCHRRTEILSILRLTSVRTSHLLRGDWEHAQCQHVAIVDLPIFLSEIDLRNWKQKAYWEFLFSSSSQHSSQNVI